MKNPTTLEQLYLLQSGVVDAVKFAARAIEHDVFSVAQKGSAENIVTSSDLKVEQILCEKLSVLLPQSQFLCEETSKCLTGEYLWIIDPIDGTTNYSRGIADFCISVALVHKGKPIVSVVYSPQNNLLFAAVCGGGATLNGQKITVSQKSFGEGLLCTAMSLYQKSLAPVCSDIINEAFLQCNDYRRFGSCALELCLLAAGRCDLYFEIRLFPWDYAGAYLVLQEAGGFIGGLHGTPLTFDKPTAIVAANNKENFDKLNSIVSSHLKELPYPQELY